MATVLLIDRSEMPFADLKNSLVTLGFTVKKLSSAEEVAASNPAAASLILLGQISELAEESLAVISGIRAVTRTPILFFPSNGSEALAVQALRAGVSDYFPRPFSLHEVIGAIQRLIGDSSPIAGGMIGECAALKKIRAQIRKVAASDASVLITGETGTGKELVAEQLYINGNRSDKPYVTLNCAAIPEALLESELFGYERGAFTGAFQRKNGLLHEADGGTLFLDEIGDMTLAAQSKILRALETGRVQRVGTHLSHAVSVRLIAATNQNIEKLMDEGRFRPDLYYRVGVSCIELPALRDRAEDIPLLIRHFLNEAGAAGVTMSNEAAALLIGHAWPGNIRQLRNVIKASLVNMEGSAIQVEDLPEPFLRSAKRTCDVATTERNRMLAVLQQTSWNMSRAAESLHWSRMTLYRKMAKHQIAPKTMSRKASA